MDSLIGLGIFLLYCLFVAWATLYAYYRAWRSGSSEKKAWTWGLVGFLATFVPMWGDIPAKMIGISMGCARDGGYRIYKSYEQWVEENKDQLASIRSYAGTASSKPIPNGVDIQINDRLKTRRTSRVSPVGVVRSDLRFIDLQTGEVLIEQVKYSSGVGVLSGIAARVTPWKILTGCTSNRKRMDDFEKTAAKYWRIGRSR